MAEAAGWGASQEVKKEPEKGLEAHWESQWQDFLERLQPDLRRWEEPVVSDAAQWDDAKAFLASFEQVAQACQWPRGEWVARLLPALNGLGEEAFGSLEAQDKGDYGKGVTIPKEVCPPLLKGDQDPTQPGNQTIFWQVLQEDGENIASLGKEILTLIRS
ncbi:hypothetical protein JRQ81_000003 [Phrynocephalus forsythii]|uniref:Uncharacterized protein n=1 Tax=Phrynocephalus forsythii TaxID=171643 RepID=A0A9Q0X5H6_9SAUR|nr:hypothetical protein JRQ81_000003 [Phrynocephalus forsythii]